ncbi:MAG: hypothetical protein K2I08_02520 [Muribaculaceae bacterium]|nr:hypothetical protein [Muribaculaceae bacterium]MDE6522946.1 hypothetical protein [Muribaculaceae bacterium]
MKKLFSSIVAISLSIVGFNAMAESSAYPDASPEAKASPAPVAAPSPAPVPASSSIEIPQAISEHLALRFPGSTVYEITREGVTYVVDLGDGLHIRYDNCFNPVCYGDHSHEQ